MIDKHVEQSKPLSEEPDANGRHRPFGGRQPKGWRPIKRVIGGERSLSSPSPRSLPEGYRNGSGCERSATPASSGPFCPYGGSYCSAAFFVALLYLWINLRLASRTGDTFGAGNLVSEPSVAATLGGQLPSTVLKLAAGTIAAITALFFALTFYGRWDTYLRFRYGGSFGLSDPLFGVDAGFYLFRLPFYELLQNSLTALALITLAAVLALYAYFGLLRFSRSRQIKGWGAKAVPHLSTLLVVLVASWGWGFYLDHYQLLYSTQGVVYGAGYTADHVTRTAYWIMTAAAGALCALLVLNIFRPRFRTILIGSGIYVGLYFIAVWLAPALFQRFMVQPNELARETPHLKHIHRIHS